jgi:hypothetical protein
MGLFDRSKKVPKGPNERFWAWFVKNKERVIVLLDDRGRGMSAYGEPTTEIKRVPATAHLITLEELRTMIEMKFY